MTQPFFLGVSFKRHDRWKPTGIAATKTAIFGDVIALVVAKVLWNGHFSLDPAGPYFGRAAAIGATEPPDIHELSCRDF
ncbi:hypothetical protein RDV64_08455 [Acuticoccus sp. MNP-M23]|uniref:hypothetical protein n=1 Tax=Acuticoccus sp. MNP-M23 TaxID=3072793 RepID=UPI0028151CF2|nr:hypothetical protein [Acuticoccus sp. MNP-M23]WMS44405.1 hypothetical protein RDV64_08455 [Acuticoccus sp. MNP-M23]